MNEFREHMKPTVHTLKDTQSDRYWLTRDHDGTRTVWSMADRPIYAGDYWADETCNCEIIACDEEGLAPIPTVTEILGTKKCFGVKKGGIGLIKVDMVLTKDIEIVELITEGK